MTLDSALAQTRPTQPHWRAWTRQEPTLRGLSWYQFRTDLRYGPADRQDELLAALVRIAQQEPEATAAIVACLAPGLRTRIARHAPGLPHDDAWAIAAAGICTAIANGDLAPRFVASRLLDAAKRHLQHAVKVEAKWHSHTHQLPDREDRAQVDDPSAALILTTAITAGILTRPDAWLIHTTRVVGHSLGYAAHQLGIRYEAAKKRRQRAEARWAAWWAPGALRRPITPLSLDPSNQEDIA